MKILKSFRKLLTFNLKGYMVIIKTKKGGQKWTEQMKQ